jgi:outer membrane protein assembly factor BamB
MGSRWLRSSIAFALCLAAAGCRTPGSNNFPTITTQPTDQTVQAGQMATFTVVATGPNLSYQWYVEGEPVMGPNSGTGATTASYTTPPTTLAENGDNFFVYVSNQYGSVESATVGLTVTGVTSSSARTLTFENDTLRTGQSLAETALTPALNTGVSASTFGKIASFATDASVAAQPLYVSSVELPGGGMRNILYAATVADTVYAFDADTGAVLWRESLLGSGETASDRSVSSCGGEPQAFGISATPAIDPTRGPRGAIYVIAASRNAAGNFSQRLHALDVATGAELAGSPVNIQPPSGSNAAASARSAFDPAAYAASSGLLLSGPKLYAVWAPMCGTSAAGNWLMAFDTGSLQLTGALHLTGDSSGAASDRAAELAGDAAGDVFVSAVAATNTAGSPLFRRNAGMALERLSTTEPLAVSELSPLTGHSSGNAPSAALGPPANSLLLLPAQADSAGRIWHLAVTADTEGDVYLVDRDALAGSPAPSFYQHLAGILAATGAPPASAYFNGTVYFAAPGDRIKAFRITTARLSAIPSSESQNALGSEGSSLAISASGAENGILWVVAAGEPAALYAYDAADLSRELYNSTEAAKQRDALGALVSPLPATIANGRVYVATAGGIAVFALRH